jgi:hypothetical protein
MNRTWAVTATNFSQSVQIAIPQTMVDLTKPTCGQLRFITASDSSISQNVVVSGNLATATINGNPYYVVNYTFPAGTSYFTFGMVNNAVSGLAYLTPTTTTITTTNVTTPSTPCSELGWTYYYAGTDVNKTQKLFAVQWGAVTPPTGFSGVITVNSGTTFADPYTKGSTPLSLNNAIMGRTLQLLPENSQLSDKVKVRIYYSQDEQANAVNGIPEVIQKQWFKHAGDMSSVMADNDEASIRNATFFGSADTTSGVEDGVNYVEISGITGFSTFGWIASNSSSPLPVTLSNFTAKAVDCEAIVSWTGAVENNLASYTVQSSATGADNSFGDVEKINAKGSGSSYNSQFSMTADNAFIRLKMTDNSGAVTYSNILSISGNCASATPVLYPNPVTNRLTIGNLGAGNKTIRIISASGAIVYINATSAQQINISAQYWAAGVYLVSVQAANGTVSTIKVVKQ